MKERQEVKEALKEYGRPRVFVDKPQSAPEPRSNGQKVSHDEHLLRRQIEYVNPERLRPSPFNPPSRTEEAALRPLLDSIRSIGIEQPLKIAHDGTVIDGHRRLACALLLELDEVPAIREPPDVDTHRLFDALNSTARRLSAFEELELYLRGGPVSAKTMKAIRWIAEACDEAIFREMEERRLSPYSVKMRAVHAVNYCGRGDDLAFRQQAVRWIVRHGQVALRRAIHDLAEPSVIIAAVEADKALELERRYGVSSRGDAA